MTKTLKIVEEGNGYPIIFSEVPHEKIRREILVRSGMLMIADGKKD